MKAQYIKSYLVQVREMREISMLILGGGGGAIKSVLSFQRKKLEETEQTELTVITRRKW